MSMPYMPKASGFSIVEVVLAGALFIVFAAALSGILLQSLESGRRNADLMAAIAYAEDGLELVRTVRQYGFSSLQTVHDGSISWNGSDGWNFTDDSGDRFDRYERRMTIEYARRDSVGMIAEDGDPDTRTLKVTSVVRWESAPGQPETVEFSEYITFWEEPIL